MRVMIFALLLALMSCKNDTTTTNNKPKELLEDNVFRVFLDGYIKTKDTFYLRYNLEENKEKELSFALRGSKKKQRIIFELPKNVVPDNFRIFLGNNEINNLSRLNRIIINLNRNRIVMTESALSTYFDLDKGVKIEEDTIVINSEYDTVNDRVLISNAKLNQRIKNKYSNR